MNFKTNFWCSQWKSNTTLNKKKKKKNDFYLSFFKKYENVKKKKKKFKMNVSSGQLKTLILFFILFFQIIHVLLLFVQKSEKEDPKRIDSLKPILNPKLKILCFVVMGNKKKTFNMLRESMYNLRDHCEWGIMTYKWESLDEIRKFVNITKQKINLPTLKVRFVDEGGEAKMKLSIWLKIRKVFLEYDYVFSFDEDISFHSFNLNDYIKKLICYFGNIPLVSQPVIWENTQTWEYCNYQSKKKKKWNKKIQNI